MIGISVAPWRRDKLWDNTMAAKFHILAGRRSIVIDHVVDWERYIPFMHGFMTTFFIFCSLARQKQPTSCMCQVCDQMHVIGIDVYRVFPKCGDVLLNSSHGDLDIPRIHIGTDGMASQECKPNHYAQSRQVQQVLAAIRQQSVGTQY